MDRVDCSSMDIDNEVDSFNEDFTRQIHEAFEVEDNHDDSNPSVTMNQHQCSIGTDSNPVVSVVSQKPPKISPSKIAILKALKIAMQKKKKQSSPMATKLAVTCEGELNWKVEGFEHSPSSLFPTPIVSNVTSSHTQSTSSPEFVHSEMNRRVCRSNEDLFHQPSTVTVNPIHNGQSSFVFETSRVFKIKEITHTSSFGFVGKILAKYGNFKNENSTKWKFLKFDLTDADGESTITVIINDTHMNRYVNTYNVGDYIRLDYFTVKKKNKHNGGSCRVCIAVNASTIVVKVDPFPVTLFFYPEVTLSNFTKSCESIFKFGASGSNAPLTTTVQFIVIHIHSSDNETSGLQEMIVADGLNPGDRASVFGTLKIVNLNVDFTEIVCAECKGTRINTEPDATYCYTCRRRCQLSTAAKLQARINIHDGSVVDVTIIGNFVDDMLCYEKPFLTLLADNSARLRARLFRFKARRTFNINDSGVIFGYDKYRR